MSEETIEQITTRLKREDEEKERAWQKRRKELEAETQRYRAEKEKEQQEKELAAEKLQKKRQQKREQELKDSALRSWLDAGGTDESFEEEWPSLKVEMLKERTMKGDSAARRQAFEHIRSGF